MPSPSEISVAQLLRLIGTPNCPELVDVCIDEDFEADPRLIPGARRYPHHSVMELIPDLRGKRVAVICQKGLKLSAGAAAVLRAEGIEAEYLEGGNFAWRDFGAPLVPYSAIPEQGIRGHTVWVTRHRPKIDRIACPWLIRRFVDPRARFLFVSPSQVGAIGEKFGATPFDVEGVYWGHRRGACTFETMLSEFKLETEPLLRMANIIRGADTNQHELAPEVAGLLAMSLGLSRMFKDDLKQLDAGMLFYDALYRWARDARDETHQCPPGKKAVQP